MDTRLHMFGTHATELMLARPAERAENLRPVFRAIGAEMLISERELFATGGASAGAPWKPVSDETRERKARDKQGAAHVDDTLIRSGEEEQSLSNITHPMNLFNVTRLFVLIGSTHPAVPFQRSGTRHMAEREPIRFTTFQRYRWEKKISDFIFHGRL